MDIQCRLGLSVISIIYPPLSFSLWSWCTKAPNRHICTAPSMQHCIQSLWKVTSVCRIWTSPGHGKPWGPDLSIVYIKRLAETCPCNLIFLPFNPAHGRVIHSPSVFRPDVWCRLEGLLGLTIHNVQKYLTTDGVWVRSLILKAGILLCLEKQCQMESCQLWL